VTDFAVAMLHKASSDQCSGTLWCQLLQMVHWDSTQINKQQLSVTMEHASMAVPDDAAQSPPLHTTRGLHRTIFVTPVAASIAQ
jgi:hypothetical protein